MSQTQAASVTRPPLPVPQVFMKPFEPFVGFLMSLLSRAFEYQADRFAKDLGHAQPLKTGLVKVSSPGKELKQPTPHSVLWFDSCIQRTCLPLWWTSCTAPTTTLTLP